MSLFSLRNVTFRYPSQKEDALQNITCEIEKGEFVAVLGGDGAGKSTFVKLLNGIIPHAIKGTFSGELLFKGTPTRNIPITGFVKEVGLALQDPDVQLFMDSIEEELAFGPENLGNPPKEIEERIARALDLMEIADLRMKSPKAISGGQKQRLVIASILAMSTETIVLDEPLSMLDSAVKKALLDTLRRMCNEQKMTVVLTSQDAEDIYRYCDKIILLKNGQLTAIGKPSEMIASSGILISAGVELPQLLEVRDRLKETGFSRSSDELAHYIFSQTISSPEGGKS